ncbi:MAG: hypothetical protein B7Z69_02670 [Actinobacteria bacterium 21-73-9]|nr:MAG: hypothetical protein B7Z69_02670 [Actinobacteria bacterium 21-73-9]
MGLVQGLTELFPVSSLGHGVLVPALLGWHNLVSSQTQTESFFLVVLVAMHVGTALGLLLYFRRTWLQLLAGLARQLRRTPETGVGALWRLRDPALDPHYRLLVLLALGSIPVGLVGLTLQSKLRELFAKPLATCVFLIVNGLILMLGEWLRRSRGRHARTVRVTSLSAGRTLGIGSSEVLALLAGISRSGVTMAAGLAGGLDHEGAANFSFLLATPVILLAGLDKVPALFGPLGDGVRTQALVGALVALVAAYAATRFLTRWFQTRTLTPFAVYCVVVGALCAARFA